MPRKRFRNHIRAVALPCDECRLRAAPIAIAEDTEDFSFVVEQGREGVVGDWVETAPEPQRCRSRQSAAGIVCVQDSPEGDGRKRAFARQQLLSRSGGDGSGTGRQRGRRPVSLLLSPSARFRLVLVLVLVLCGCPFAPCLAARADAMLGPVDSVD